MPVNILTLTLNPSIDLSATTETVTPEHKLRCADMQRDPGGGGINVARVLARCGVNCHAVYPAGGILGRLLHRLLDDEGVPSITIEIASETRESFTVLERGSGREFRFVLPGPHLEAREWQACLDRIADFPQPLACVVASGSLPPGAPEDFYARLAKALRKRGSRLALDASGPALAAALDEGVYLVKPNLRELRELSGNALEGEADWLGAARAIVSAGKAQLVALSLGHRGAMLVGADLSLRAQALSVPIASTVGAGDSFLAAIVWRLVEGASLEEAFRYGMAGGAAALLSPGTSLAHKDDIERLASLVQVQALHAGGPPQQAGDQPG
jgi:6-phosphofructokinase 2